MPTNLFPPAARSVVARNPVTLPSRTPAIELDRAQIECLIEFREAISLGDLTMREVPCISGTEPAEAHLVADRERYGLGLNTFLCHKTGLMWVSPCFDSDSAAEFYRRFYRRLYTGSSTPKGPWASKQRRHGREILNYVRGTVPPGVVFDIGCGMGATVLPFKEAGWTASGCDYGADFIEAGRELGLDLHVGDYQALGAAAPCDLLIASHVLEHTLDPSNELRGWSELVAEGGYLYIEVPGVFRAYDDYRTLERFLHIAHTYHFTLDSLRAVMAPLGLEMVKGDESVRGLFRKVGHPVPAPDTSALADRILRFISWQESPTGRLALRLRRPLLKLALSLRRRLGRLTERTPPRIWESMSL